MDGMMPGAEAQNFAVVGHGAAFDGVFDLRVSLRNHVCHRVGK